MASKQEKIKELLAAQFRIARQEGALRKWADGKVDAGAVLAYLHSKGVVIKVVRELPPNPYTRYDPHEDTNEEELAYKQAQNDMSDYSATESLIKE